MNDAHCFDWESTGKGNMKEFMAPYLTRVAKIIPATRQNKCLIGWGLTALSAQTGYIVPLKSMLQLKSEINA